MFIAAFLQQPKHVNNLSAQPTEHWFKNIYIYTMDYYSALRKNETLTFAATWIDLENITLSDVSQRNTNT